MVNSYSSVAIQLFRMSSSGLLYKPCQCSPSLPRDKVFSCRSCYLFVCVFWRISSWPCLCFWLLLVTLTNTLTFATSLATHLYSPLHTMPGMFLEQHHYATLEEWLISWQESITATKQISIPFSKIDYYPRSSQLFSQHHNIIPYNIRPCTYSILLSLTLTQPYQHLKIRVFPSYLEDSDHSTIKTSYYYGQLQRQ